MSECPKVLEGVSMAEDQEKAIARERMDERIAMFVVGPVTFLVASLSILFFWGGRP